MRRGRLSLLSLLFALTPLTLADVEFLTPAGGSSIAAGPITVTWKDSGIAPSISLLKSYTLQLVVGGNDITTDALPLITIGTGQGLFSAGNEATGTITPAIASTITNGFYFAMISTAKDGGTVTNYSPRFTITGMTGTTLAKYVNAVPASYADVPPTVNDVSPGAAQKSKAAAVPVAATPAAAADPADFSIPYNLQTGLQRYAPMQPIPPTQITANNPTPLFPTSAFDIARAALPPASVTTTITQPQTFSVQSMQNTIAAQSQPTGDMERFLARWKD